MTTASSCTAMPSSAVATDSWRSSASGPSGAPRAPEGSHQPAARARSDPRPAASSRWWRSAVAALAAWRAAARERAALRALAALDRRVLHDIGLADRVPPPSALDWRVLERSRW